METRTTRNIEAPAAVADSGSAALRARGEPSVLVEGRTLVARVVELGPGSRALLAVGERLLEADARVPLRLGAVYALGAERSSDGAWLLHLAIGASPALAAGVVPLAGRLGRARSLAEILIALAAELRHAALRPGSDGAAATRLLRALAAHVHEPGGSAAPGGPGGPGGTGATLRELVARSGLTYEVRLLAADAAGSAAREIARGDLKAELLRAAADPSGGATRDAALRGLRALEAEQLVQLALREDGRPAEISIPLRDPANDGAWSTARLIVERRRDDEHTQERPDAPGEAEEARAMLAVDLSRLGPVQADIRLAAGRVEVRLVAASEDALARLRRGLPELEARLSRLERSALVVAAHASGVPTGPLPERRADSAARSIDVSA